MSLAPLWRRLSQLEAQAAALACPTLIRRDLLVSVAQACEAAGIAGPATAAMCEALEGQLATIRMPSGLISKARVTPLLKAMAVALLEVAEAHQLDIAHLLSALDAAAAPGPRGTAGGRLSPLR